MPQKAFYILKPFYLYAINIFHGPWCKKESHIIAIIEIYIGVRVVGNEVHDIVNENLSITFNLHAYILCFYYFFHIKNDVVSTFFVSRLRRRLQYIYIYIYIYCILVKYF